MTLVWMVLAWEPEEIGAARISWISSSVSAFKRSVIDGILALTVSLAGMALMMSTSVWALGSNGWSAGPMVESVRRKDFLIVAGWLKSGGMKSPWLMERTVAPFPAILNIGNGIFAEMPALSWVRYDSKLRK